VTRDKLIADQVDVPSAAVWLISGSRRIYLFIVKIKYRGAKYVSSTLIRGLWNGVAGLNIERWEFWKARLAIIASMSDLKASTRRYAVDAGAAMQAAQNEVDRVGGEIPSPMSPKVVF
jgi:Protein of unknown function (DUF3632)